MILTVVIRRTERVLLHRPARWKYNEIGDGSARSETRTGKNSENAGITVIKANRIDDHKLGQIVFIGHIIAMPGNHIEDTMILLGHK